MTAWILALALARVASAELALSLPEGAGPVRWVLAPSSASRSEARVRWAVDDTGRAWVGRDGEVINPSGPYRFRLSKDFEDVAVFPRKALVFCAGGDIGFIAPVREAPHSGDVPVLPFQPLYPSPVDECRLSDDGGASLLVDGVNPETGRHELYRLTRRAGEPRELKRIFGSDVRAGAVTGDGVNVYVASRRKVFRIRPSGPPEVVMEHDQEVVSLAWSKAVGLFYATADEAGFVGKGGPEAFLAGEVELRARGEVLYLLFKDSLAVASVDGLRAFAR